MYEQIIPFGILVLCSSPRGIWFIVWSSHALDLVVMMYFLDGCSVLSGMWCGLDVGLILMSVVNSNEPVCSITKENPYKNYDDLVCGEIIYKGVI
jgi:hypothetical protein